MNYFEPIKNMDKVKDPFRFVIKKYKESCFTDNYVMAFLDQWHTAIKGSKLNYTSKTIRELKRFEKKISEEFLQTLDEFGQPFARAEELAEQARNYSQAAVQNLTNFNEDTFDSIIRDIERVTNDINSLDPASTFNYVAELQLLIDAIRLIRNYTLINMLNYFSIRLNALGIKLAFYLAGLYFALKLDLFEDLFTTSYTNISVAWIKIGFYLVGILVTDIFITGVMNYVKRNLVVLSVGTVRNIYQKHREAIYYLRLVSRRFPEVDEIMRRK